MQISFFAAGQPRPAGSKSAAPFRRKNGKLGVRVFDACKYTKDWQHAIAVEAARAVPADFELTGLPVCLELAFFLPRPKSHFKHDGSLKVTAPDYHTIRPDRDKLTRAVSDAITGVLYLDDAQICAGSVTKMYGPTPGVRVTLSTL